MRRINRYPPSTEEFNTQVKLFRNKVWLDIIARRRYELVWDLLN